MRRILPVMVLAVGAAALFARADDGEELSRVTFHEHILPLFKEKCVGCHGGDKPKGDLSLETIEAALKGGEEGECLQPGKPAESLLYLLITGAEKPLMPPRNKGTLEASEVELVRRWIEGGCAAGERPTDPAPYSRPLAPPVYRRPPVLRALAFADDGSSLYVAGFREILVHAFSTDDVGDGAAEQPPLPRARLVGESEQINAMELSPDGTLLAAVGGNAARFGELQLWDLRTSELLRFARIGKDTLYAVAFSPAGDRVAVAGTDRAIHVIDVATAAEVFAAEIHADWVFGVAFDGDGSHLVSGSRDKTLKVSAAADGSLLSNLGDPKGNVYRVLGRPGSRHVLAAGESRVPVLFDLEKMKELRSFEQQPGALLATAFSRDGTLVAVGGSAQELRVYSVDDGKRLASLRTPERWTYAVAIHPAKKHVVASGYDGRVRVFEIDSGEAIRDFVPVPIGRSMRF